MENDRKPALSLDEVIERTEAFIECYKDEVKADLSLERHNQISLLRDYQESALHYLKKLDVLNFLHP